jgi:hypothetical protein
MVHARVEALDSVGRFPLKDPAEPGHALPKGFLVFPQNVRPVASEQVAVEEPVLAVQNENGAEAASVQVTIQVEDLARRSPLPEGFVQKKDFFLVLPGHAGGGPPVSALPFSSSSFKPRRARSERKGIYSIGIFLRVLSGLERNSSKARAFVSTTPTGYSTGAFGTSLFFSGVRTEPF